MGGWLEIWRLKLISTQVVVEVEVGVELGNDLPMWKNFLGDEEHIYISSSQY